MSLDEKHESKGEPHNMKTIAVILGLAFTALAADTWEKMKDCTARADKIVADQLRDSGHVDGYDSSNHYSPKYNHCYVRFTIYSISSRQKDGTPKGFAHTTLIDAYEGDDLATIHEPMNDKESRAWCTIGGSSDSCPAAWAFIDDHMHN
jgi:hypothetical protein